MLQHIQLLRNIGSFDSITPGSTVPFDQFNLLYAENGRGKTTLATVLRSLGSGDTGLILNRHRLGAMHPPQVILAVQGVGSLAFQNDTWSAPLPTIVVFDDNFVAENVCSGIAIDTEHRQNLHELILGAQGAALSAALQRQVNAIEEHNRQLRLREEGIPVATRGGLTIDEFCALKPEPDIEAKIVEAERALAAARESERVNAEPEFQNIKLPAFDLTYLEQLLARDLPSLDRDATVKVQAHLAMLGPEGELWVAEGMTLMQSREQELQDGHCPFCAQLLEGSIVITHYREYFSAAYTGLKGELAAATRALKTQHGTEVLAAFEREVRVTVQRRGFWVQFAEVPAFEVDTAAVALAWKEARDAVAGLLNQKQAAPLDPICVDELTRAKLASYKDASDTVGAAIRNLLDQNHEIALVKERARTSDGATLTSDLGKLNTAKRRFEAWMVPLCDALTAEKDAKAATERARTQARHALEQYRTAVFPAYQGTINDYLGRLGAGFRLDNVASVNTRAGSSATYTVLINNQPVGLTSDTGPSFKTALSSGDRNTLALAFFFASLEQDSALADKIVVIDDPMSSLDEHRTLVTVEEIVKMARRVRQVIVLSHSKPFLLSLWKSGPKNSRAAMRISRAQNGSSLALWRANEDAVAEHDRRYGRVRTYVAAADPSMERAVAADLRPMLEAWARIAYPIEFPPEEMLGGFLNRCEQVVRTRQQIIKQADIDELKGLTNYANLFHHDTNPTYQTQHINDQQLAQFSARTLAFIQKA
jgi:wobble nucleotide-excising tRNase